MLSQEDNRCFRNCAFLIDRGTALLKCCPSSSLNSAEWSLVTPTLLVAPIALRDGLHLQLFTKNLYVLACLPKLEYEFCFSVFLFSPSFLASHCYSALFTLIPWIHSVCTLRNIADKPYPINISKFQFSRPEEA